MSDRIEGKVARIVSEDELIINRGASAGVRVGMIFWVVDTRVLDVVDPDSGAPLGSIDRPLAKFKITAVEPQIALGVQHSSRGSMAKSLQNVLGAPERRSSLTTASWPEGVRIGDAVIWNGEQVTQGPSGVK